MTTFLTVSKSAASHLSALPSQQSFSQKLITLTITLSPTPQGNSSGVFQGTGVAGADGTNQVILSGSRTSVRAESNGAPAGSMAEIMIWGLTPSLMNQLTTIGMTYPSTINRNSITVSAGDAVVGVAPVFSGTVLNAYADYLQAPSVPLRMTCQSGTIDAVASSLPTSYQGPVNVATVMAGLARQMNLGFINAGVSVMISKVYLRGNLETQVHQLAEWAHIKAERVQGDTILAIWPIGQSWQSGVSPLLSKDTGMIGSPTLSIFGPVVKMIFNPQVAFGGTIQIQSPVVPQANGTWYVQKLDLALDSLVPDGKWDGTAHCNGMFTVLPTPAAP